MLEKTNMSCGVKMMWGAYDWEESLKNLAYGNYKTVDRTAIVVFSGPTIPGVGCSGWIQQLLALINKAGLGQVTQSPAIQNNRYGYDKSNNKGTGTVISVWVWTLDVKALHEWWMTTNDIRRPGVAPPAQAPAPIVIPNPVNAVFKFQGQ